VITTIVFDVGFCFLQLELGIGVGRDVFGVGTWGVGRYTRFHKGRYLFSSILLIPMQWAYNKPSTYLKLNLVVSFPQHRIFYLFSAPQTSNQEIFVIGWSQQLNS
jgi:hypothetical protein